MEGYRRVEFSLAAVRDEDLLALRDALAAAREFSAGGSSLSIETVRPGTVLNSPRATEHANGSQ